MRVGKRWMRTKQKNKTEKGVSRVCVCWFRYLVYIIREGLFEKVNLNKDKKAVQSESRVRQTEEIFFGRRKNKSVQSPRGGSMLVWSEGYQGA